MTLPMDEKDLEWAEQHEAERQQELARELEGYVKRPLEPGFEF